MTFDTADGWSNVGSATFGTTNFAIREPTGANTRPLLISSASVSVL